MAIHIMDANNIYRYIIVVVVVVVIVNVVDILGLPNSLMDYQNMEWLLLVLMLVYYSHDCHMIVT